MRQGEIFTIFGDIASYLSESTDDDTGVTTLKYIKHDSVLKEKIQAVVNESFLPITVPTKDEEVEFLRRQINEILSLTGELPLDISAIQKLCLGNWDDEIENVLEWYKDDR